jgi:hypothetical protein
MFDLVGTSNLKVMKATVFHSNKGLTLTFVGVKLLGAILGILRVFT